MTIYESVKKAQQKETPSPPLPLPLARVPSSSPKKREKTTQNEKKNSKNQRMSHNKSYKGKSNRKYMYIEIYIDFIENIRRYKSLKYDLLFYAFFGCKR